MAKTRIRSKNEQAKNGYRHGERNQHTGQLTTTWLTPQWLIEALGPFDTDAACPTGGMPWKTAERMVTEQDDSLAMDWKGFGYTWLNAPWGPEQWEFIDRLDAHGNGIALLRARTNTKAFHRYAWQSPNISGVFFFSGAKLTFHNEDGTKADHCDPWPCVLLVYGSHAINRLKMAILEGKVQGTLIESALHYSKIG